MSKYTVNDIRNLWLDFFKSKDHFVIESKSLIPVNDPSLLWINSGVATLKNFFSGKENPPAPRLTNCQRSIRTNDIENVGVTSRHHTFFEMLGNFSIGDYFKVEAIGFAYEFLTKVLKFDLRKIYITVFKDDNEAYATWIKLGINPSHLIKCGRDRNFWDLGQGPCGPCTEIYFDRGPKFDPKNIGEKLFFNDIENDRYVEIWNVVFSEFNNDGNGNYTELSRKNIDTGAGLERVSAILQDVPTNYDINTFAAVYREIEKYTDRRYDESAYFKKDKNSLEVNRNFIVLVDHFKANIFAIADGASPSGKERGSVLRKLIRRALICAKRLELSGAYVDAIVNTIINNEKCFYPYLVDQKNNVIEVIKNEISLFEKTLEIGLKLFEQACSENNLDSEVTFKLVETYGFPLELIKELASEKGIKLDTEGFEEKFRHHQEISKGNNEGKKGMASQNENLVNFTEKSTFVYDQTKIENASVIAMFSKDFVPQTHSKECGWLVFDQTPFYATSGGQSCDSGTIRNTLANKSLEVDKVMKGPNHQHFHFVSSLDGFAPGTKVDLAIDCERRMACTRNHSAEHLLHKALTQVIDKNIKQEGASKTPEKLTFDFQYFQKPTKEQIQQVEDRVNEFIHRSENVETIFASLDEAKSLGAFAYFEDVYAKISTKLRVVKMGDTSIELCGGTHVHNVGDIEQFLIIRCQPKGAGSYRIEAISSKKLINEYIGKFTNEAKKKIDVISRTIADHQTSDKSELIKLIGEIKWNDFKHLEEQIAHIESVYADYIKQYNLNEKHRRVAKLIKDIEENISKDVVFHELLNCDSKVIPDALSDLIGRYPSKCFVIVNICGEKTQYFVSTKRSDLPAVTIIKSINGLVSGFGNGKETYAQGGTSTKNASEAIKKYVAELN